MVITLVEHTSLEGKNKILLWLKESVVQTDTRPGSNGHEKEHIWLANLPIISMM